MALFISRMREQIMRKGKVTADWMESWGLLEQTSNLPYVKRTPAKLYSLHRYDMELAYLAPRGHNETIKAYRKSFYMTIRTILRAVTREQKMRVQ